MIMKNLTLIMLASAVIFATSCLGSGVSKSDYTIVGFLTVMPPAISWSLNISKTACDFPSRFLPMNFPALILLTMKIIPFSMADSAYR